MRPPLIAAFSSTAAVSSLCCGSDLPACYPSGGYSHHVVISAEAMRRDAAVLKFCSLQRQVESSAESLIGRPPLQVKTCLLRLLAFGLLRLQLFQHDSQVK